MTYETLEDPKAFTMSQFLPLFALMLTREQKKFDLSRQIIEDLQVKRKNLIEQFTDPSISQFETSENHNQKSGKQRGNVTVNIFKLETEKRGALVSIS